MKLLFNKDENFSEECRSILGFTDADLQFIEMKTDLKSASRAFIKEFGAALYQQFEDLYHADEVIDLSPDPDPDPTPDPAPDPDPVEPQPEPLTEEQEMEILEQIQTVILLDAYKMYIVNRDLAHTEDGRKIRLDDNEKIPFDWILDRSNENLERKYYRAIDELLELIENVPAWTSSDAYTTMHSSWVNKTDHITQYYPQATRLLLLKMAPGLIKSQRNEIIPRIGKGRFNAINDFPEKSADEVFILEKSREAMVYSAIHWTLIRHRVTIFPEGILQAYTGDRNTTRARKVAENEALELTALAFKNDAAQALLELENKIAELDKAAQPDVIIPPRKDTLGNADDKFIAV